MVLSLQKLILLFPLFGKKNCSCANLFIVTYSEIKGLGSFGIRKLRKVLNLAILKIRPICTQQEIFLENFQSVHEVSVKFKFYCLYLNLKNPLTQNKSYGRGLRLIIEAKTVFFQ